MKARNLRVFVLEKLCLKRMECFFKQRLDGVRVGCAIEQVYSFHGFN